MGVILNQAIKGAIWSYIGAFLGFLNTGLLLPKIISSDEVGIIQVLLALSIIMAQISSLGINNVTLLLFPYFRNPRNCHNGFVSLALLIANIGFFVLLISSFFFKDWLIMQNSEKSSLFADYAILLIPLTFFTLIFSVLDSYKKALYNAVIGTFLREFVVRVLNSVVIILFYFNVIDFKILLYLYVLSCSLPGIILIILVFVEKEFTLKLNFNFITPQLRRKISKTALIGIITGFSGIAVVNIDKYMVAKMIDLDMAGIYSIAFFFGSIILLPSRSLNKISSTFLAESWKKNDTKAISEVYSKSSVNLFVIATLVFVGLWGNIHNVLKILPPQYVQGQGVILYVGLANVFIMMSGASILVLNTSRLYAVQTWFMLGLIVVVVLANLVLIPVWGITGAALSTLISTVIIFSARMIFIWIKFKMFPIGVPHLKVVLIGVFCWFLLFLVPHIENLFLDIFIRGSLLVIVYVFLTLAFKVSSEAGVVFQEFKRKVQG